MEQKKVKKTAKRSPNFPVISLEEAVDNTRKLYNADGRAGSLKSAVYNHLGYKGEHGASITVVSAMKKYGLITEEKSTIYLTHEAELILIGSDEEEKRNAIKECALMPDIYKKLWSEYSERGLPSDTSLRHTLIFHYNFNEKSVDGFIKNFRATLKYAGITLGEKTTRDENSDISVVKNETTENNMPKISNINKDTIVQDYVIPRKQDRIAVLRLEKPVTNDEIDLIVKWLDLLRSTIVDKVETVDE